MISAFREDRSHFEPDSPSPHSSVQGAGIAPGERASNVPLRGSDEASSGDHVKEKGAEVPLTKRQKVKRHCGRFWWWYLIGLIVFLAIFLPVLFLVIVPAIVQDIVNDQSFPVYGGAFVAVSPTQLRVSLNTELDTPLAADIDPLTLFLYNKNTEPFSPFLNVTLPKLHVDGKTPVNVVDQLVTITNQSELESWFSEVFDLSQVELSVRGKADIHLGALHASPKVEKTVTVSSLNQLTGFGIQDLQLVYPALDNGTNIKGTLNLPNSGALNLGLGDLALNLMSGDVRIGLINIYEVNLPPGNNTRYFDGELFLSTIIQNLGAVLASQASALADGNIQIDATGNATTVNGEHIGFIEAILNNKRVTSTTPVVKLLTDAVSSLAGTSMNGSIIDMLGEIFGNSTLIEDVLSHWPEVETNNLTSKEATTKIKRSLLSATKGLPRSTALNLLRLGLRAGASKY
ncbi:hypothetical protein F4778DRAFT_525778 [Xylariomycetidae sp. FL2044]|nr:hypothetical protein F4778DRAFT_525778 [Xylariomycetidae sp. FL2044]